MVNFKEEVAKLIAEHVEGLEIEEIIKMVEVPQDSKMGDYAFPCFKLAKVLRKAPPMIAKDIAEKIIEKEADYILQVKGNQQSLMEDIALYFEKDIFLCKNTIDHKYKCILQI